jgi:L-asparaginase II
MARLMAQVWRGDFIESVHEASASVWDASGKEIFTAGNPQQKTFLRSSAKPFQAATLYSSGAAEKLQLKPEWIAIACASHNGEPLHQACVEDFLAHLQLNEKALKCGPQVPMAFNYGWQGERLKSYGPVTNNCSGKHTGMLAMAKAMNQTTQNYLDYDHPVQKAILENVKKYAETANIPLARDGCSAPVFYVSVSAMAKMYLHLAMGSDGAMSRIFDIMSRFPYLIAGYGRFDTHLMQAAPGKIVTKVGAEGVQGAAVKMGDGRFFGINLKVLDGNNRVSGLLLIQILKHLQLISKAELATVANWDTIPLKNHAGLTIGKIDGLILE